MNVTLLVSTKAQDFPVGTVDSQFVFNIKAVDGTVVATQTVDVPTAVFSAVADGSYIAEVIKNATSVTQAFDVVTAPTTVSLQVPDTLTVQLG